MLKVAFPLIGGIHQLFFTMPVASYISGVGDVEVVVFASDTRVMELAREVTNFYPQSKVTFKLLRRSRMADYASQLFARASWSKVPMLWSSRDLFSGFDAIVTPECTSVSFLRKVGAGACLICIPHGAGDRAISFEKRFRRFDRVLVAGQKSRERMVASGVSPEAIRIIGYPKAEFIAQRASRRPPLFDNPLPVVLYNPHFRKRLSSLAYARDISKAIIASGRFNLIIAPHIRTFENSRRSELLEWSSLASPGRVIVDTGSDRLVDMTYTAAADIYLGDVSSQTYEFLSLALRPCVFINSHNVDWRDDPDYAFWHLGEVVAGHHGWEVLVGLDRASSEHHRFIDAQKRALAETLDGSADSCRLASDEIISCILEEGSAHRASAAARLMTS